MKPLYRQKKRLKKQLWKIKNTSIKFRIGTGICFGLLVCSLLYITVYYSKQQEADLRYEELRADTEVPAVQNIQEVLETEEEVFPKEEEDTIDLSLWKDNIIDFDKLWEVNEDVYAWIEIPGTQVDYPVLQHPEEDEYYLNHTIDRVEGRPGSVYSEKIHPKDFSASNTILYGHNMKNRTMFGTLHDYEDTAFFQEYPYIYIYLPERTLVYQIFAVSVFSDAYLPWYCDFESEEGFTSFFQEIKELAMCYDESIEPEYGSKVLTLSTCVYNHASQRFLVEAVLIEEYQK